MARTIIMALGVRAKVAARENNAGGVGIAYDLKAAGIRFLGGRITTTD